jgi:hypothetical protein
MDDVWTQVIAAAVGAVITVLWRLVDRWLPDERHPLPPRPDVPPATPPDGLP